MSGTTSGTELEAPTPGEGLAVIIDQLIEALRMPQGGGRKVETWEKLVARMPEIEDAARELRDALDENTPLEDIREVVPVVLKLVGQLGEIADMDPPSFRQTTEYYLRQNAETLARVEKKLDWHMRVAHGSDIAEQWEDGRVG